MKTFTEKIVYMMKAEKLFQTQGGPIILSQARKWGLNIFLGLLSSFNFALVRPRPTNYNNDHLLMAFSLTKN